MSPHAEWMACRLQSAGTPAQLQEAAACHAAQHKAPCWCGLPGTSGEQALVVAHDQRPIRAHLLCSCSDHDLQRAASSPQPVQDPLCSNRQGSCIVTQAYRQKPRATGLELTLELKIYIETQLLSCHLLSGRQCAVVLKVLLIDADVLIHRLRSAGVKASRWALIPLRAPLHA